MGNKAGGKGTGYVVHKGDGRVVAEIAAERSVCPGCGAPVDLVDLFGVFELRLDPPEVVADAIAAGGTRTTWGPHVCRKAEAGTPTPPV